MLGHSIQHTIRNRVNVFSVSIDGDAVVSKCEVRRNSQSYALQSSISALTSDFTAPSLPALPTTAYAYVGQSSNFRILSGPSDLRIT